jgi:hypothetical protein
MKIYVTNGQISGAVGEIKRLVRKDREYVVELKETKQSKNKRLKNKLKK